MAVHSRSSPSPRRNGTRPRRPLVPLVHGSVSAGRTTGGDRRTHGQSDRDGEPQARRNRLATDPGATRQGRFPISLDRRILLEAEREGRRDDRHHGLDRTAAAVPDRDLPDGLLRRPGAAAHDDRSARSRARPSRSPTPDPRICTSAAGSRPPGSTIPDDWPSGVYLGRLTTLVDGDSEPYWQSYVVFIVRDDRPADILFQCSDNTWQAYNRWPNHYSLYTHPKGDQGPWADVSFDRPYGREAQHDAIVDDPLTFGSGEFLPFEFPLAYWLEQHGYDVTYCSNSDMLTPDRRPALQGIHQRRP